MADESSAQEQSQSVDEERERAKEEVRKLEESPPENLEDWPDGKAKYETFGGPEGDQTYEESATAKLGPSDVRHHEDGSVSVEGEQVDDPDEYKGEPIPGGPTDPDAPALPGEQDRSENGARPSDADDST